MKTTSIISTNKAYIACILGAALLGMFAITGITHAEELKVTFSATPQTIDIGGKTTLSWHSANAVECVVVGDEIFTGFGAKKTKYVGLGSDAVGASPEKTTVYSISCKGSNSTFVPAYAEAKVTVRGTEDATGSGTSGSSSSSDPNFTTGCVANPERAKKGDVVSFVATSVGGEGTLHYQWSGDVVGGGQKIFDSFTSSGTKTATLTVTDSRDITVTTACNVFIEPDSGTIASNTSGSQSAGGAQSQTTTQTPPAETSDTDKKGNEELLAATAESDGNGLVWVLVIAILINMAILFYFFVYAKKKKEEKAKANGNGQEYETLAISQ